MMRTWHIGVDDTDSRYGMCTTYLATKIVDFLLTIPVEFLDFPRLIRLNPNIPYKTRGNGAVAITFSTLEENEEKIWKGIKNLVKNYSDLKDPKTDPGLVFMNGDIPQVFSSLYNEALFQVIPLDHVLNLLENHQYERHFFIKNGRGLIGATAAIGANYLSDYTFELIVYRDPNKKNHKRLIDKVSVINADKNNPLTFNNYDYEHHQIMIAPHGPDPVLCGIRGETSKAVIKMWESIDVFEPIQTTMVFRTNQHTQVHFPREFYGNEIKPYLSVKVRGKVIKNPTDFPGGHVIFTIKSGDREIDCAAYEPTKRFRKIIRELREGDEIIAFGGVRPASEKTPLTINLEELQVIWLVNELIRTTPKCPKCGSSLTSAGKNQGFKCKKCSYISIKKEYFYINKGRTIRTGIRYVIPVCAQRHLTKPVSRDIALQFHISPEQSFKKSFYDFLSKREQLINHTVERRDKSVRDQHCDG
jgi:tRNA(Ile2)-agmatinylcytidine synthase